MAVGCIEDVDMLLSMSSLLLLLALIILFDCCTVNTTITVGAA